MIAKHEITLFELAAADGRLFSPACWRTRLSLAHLDLEVERQAVGFTQIGKIAPGVARSVPVLLEVDEVLADSWDIAIYLNRKHDPLDSLFGGSEALSHFVQNWSVADLMPHMIRMIVADIHALLKPQDQDYFLASRQRRFGRPLEQVQSDREDRVARFRVALDPLRMQLTQGAWLAGESPSYADYVILALFHWSRSMSEFELLTPDDPLHEWLGRGDLLFDGLLAKQARFW